MSKGGGEPSVTYQQSPQQAQMLNAIMPLIYGLANYGVGNMTRAPGNEVSPTPVINVLDSYSGQRENMFNRRRVPRDTGDVPVGLSYNNPSANLPLQNTGQVTSLFEMPNAPVPTSGWYNSIAPEVMQGLWEPYNDAASQMMEQLNYQGTLGSGGRYTGNALGNLGDFYSKAGTQIGTQAWNLMSPGLTQDYNTELSQKMMPYQLMGMAPSAMPTGMVQNQSNPLGGMFTGGLLGGLGASAFGWNPFLGAGIGALGGLFSS